jgi:hypothetical protein
MEVREVLDPFLKLVIFLLYQKFHLLVPFVLVGNL